VGSVWLVAARDARRAFLSSLPTLVLGSSSTKNTHSGTGVLGHRAQLGMTHDLVLDIRGLQRCAGAGDDECCGPLAPFGIRQSDHGNLGNRGMLADNALDLERGYPFAARLDDVFEPIRDLQIALGVDGADVLRVQVSAAPQNVCPNPSPQWCRRVLHPAERAHFQGDRYACAASDNRSAGFPGKRSLSGSCVPAA
jgi:hypothetical protein